MEVGALASVIVFFPDIYTVMEKITDYQYIERGSPVGGGLGYGDVPDITFFPVVALSCLLFQIGFKYISPVISDKYIPQYKKLPYAKQIYWHTW